MAMQGTQGWTENVQVGGWGGVEVRGGGRVYVAKYDTMHFMFRAKPSQLQIKFKKKYINKFFPFKFW